MKKYVPFYKSFEDIKLFEEYHGKILIGVALISIILNFFNKDEIVKIISICLLIILGVFSIMIEGKRNELEKNRINDLFDNSFNTKFNHDPSKGYYDNDDISNGIYKMGVNVFESSFFSMNILKKMRERALIINSCCAIMILFLAVYGFSRTQIALPILQLIISNIFIKKLIDVSSYYEQTKSIFNDFKRLFDEEKRINGEKLSRIQPEIIKLCVQYQSNVLNFKMSLNSKIYDDLNLGLTKEWEELRNRYNIKGGSQNECK